MKNIFTQKRLDNYLMNERWQEARHILKRELKKNPNSHWLLTRIGTTYYQENKYKKALDYIEHAYEIDKYCPLVRWELAGVHEMLGHNTKAVILYKGIIKQGTKKVAHSNCGEGIRWSRAIINDCRFCLGSIYYDDENYSLAQKYLTLYIKRKKKGDFSHYSIKKARIILKAVSNKKNNYETQSKN